LAAEIQPERRLLSRPCYANRQDGLAVLLKKRTRIVSIAYLMAWDTFGLKPGVEANRLASTSVFNYLVWHQLGTKTPSWKAIFEGFGRINPTESQRVSLVLLGS
jgi:hypothetical protein